MNHIIINYNETSGTKLFSMEEKRPPSHADVKRTLLTNGYGAGDYTAFWGTIRKNKDTGEKVKVPGRMRAVISPAEASASGNQPLREVSQHSSVGAGPDVQEIIDLSSKLGEMSRGLEDLKKDTSLLLDHMEYASENGWGGTKEDDPLIEIARGFMSSMGKDQKSKVEETEIGN